MKHCGPATLVLCIASFYISVAPALGQQQPPGVPTTIVVTLEPRHSKTIPPVEQNDIEVRQGRDVRPIQEFRPLGPSASSQLMLLIDDSARASFDTEINTLKQFLTSLPPNYEVAVAYMRNGMAAETQAFTKDHAKAANSIRVAYGPGGADVSPYDSLSDAAKKWPKPGADRKVVVMISSGIEALGGGYNPDNPYVNAGISDAQRAGLIVYGIYSPSVGHAGHSFWRNTWGQNFLSQLADQTGGESYMIGFGSPVSFQPFLEQISRALDHQYRLTFTARPEKKSGLQPINVSIKNKDASIAAPDKVYVRAGM
jgi:hypothetical protein